MPDQLAEFKSRIEDLILQFESGIDQGEWVTRRYPKKFRDDARQIREIPALYLQKGPIKLLLDPIGFDLPGVEGLADIYLMPAYDPEASVYFEDGQWMITYDVPPDPLETHPVVETQRLPVTGESINLVLNAIAEHAVPSV